MKDFKTYRSRRPGGIRITISADAAEKDSQGNAMWIAKQISTEIIKENRRRRHRGGSAISTMIEVSYGSGSTESISS